MESTGVCQFRVTCPKCTDETWLVTEQTNPIMVRCRGCSAILVIQDNWLYSVSEDFLKTKIMSKFKVLDCGKIVNHVPRSGPIKTGTKGSADKQILNLKKILGEDMDVSDFIKRI